MCKDGQNSWRACSHWFQSHPPRIVYSGAWSTHSTDDPAKVVVVVVVFFNDIVKLIFVN